MNEIELKPRTAASIKRIADTILQLQIQIQLIYEVIKEERGLEGDYSFSQDFSNLIKIEERKE